MSTIAARSAYSRRARIGRWRNVASAAAAVTVTLMAPCAIAAPTSNAIKATSAETEVHYRTVSVDGINIFYREAGDPNKPTMLLLHGFPASSHEFRNLMPLLAARFHLVAPDYPGFGFSDAPSAMAFEPSFAKLTSVMERFISTIGLTRFTIYMHDFGGPVGLRIAVAHPEMIDALIIQNANAYEAGVAPDVLKDMRVRAAGPLSAESAAALEQMLSPAGTKFQYLTGVRDPTDIDPASYGVDSWIQALPEQHRIQRALIASYYDNVRQYSAWQKYLRQRQPRTLIVWGKSDPIFLPAGVDAYRADLPKAEVHLLDTGHFAIEEDAPEIAWRILQWSAK